MFAEINKKFESPFKASKLFDEVDFNEFGKIYKGDELLGELKPADVKKLSSFARDFRIVYRVGVLQGNEEKGTLTGRIDAFVLED